MRSLGLAACLALAAVANAQTGSSSTTSTSTWTITQTLSQVVGTVTSTMPCSACNTSSAYSNYSTSTAAPIYTSNSSISTTATPVPSSTSFPGAANSLQGSVALAMLGGAFALGAAAL